MTLIDSEDVLKIIKEFRKDNCFCHAISGGDGKCGLCGYLDDWNIEERIKQLTKNGVNTNKQSGVNATNHSSETWVRIPSKSKRITRVSNLDVSSSGQDTDKNIPICKCGHEELFHGEFDCVANINPKWDGENNYTACNCSKFEPQEVKE